MNSVETLQVWIMPNAGFDTRKIFQTEIRHFKKKYPDIEVNFTIIPWSLSWYRLMDVVKEKDITNIPDVIQIGSTWTSTFAYLKGIEKIDNELINSTDYNLMPQLEASSNYGPLKNNVYSVPWFADIRVLYYRQDIMDDLGIDKEELSTWESYMGVCKKLKEQTKYNISPMHLSGQKESILIHDIAPWIWGAGGEMLAVDDGDEELKFINDKAVNGIDYYFNLLAKKYLLLWSQISPNYTGDFFSGMSAMQISGAWPKKSFFNPRHNNYSETVAKNFRVALLPEGPGGRSSYVGGSNLAITKYCKNPEAAHKLISFLLSSTSQIRHASSIGMFPSRMDVFNKFFADKDKDKQEIFQESVKIGKTLPNTIALGILEQQFTKFTNKLIQSMKDKKYSEKLLADSISLLYEDTKLILKALEEKEHDY